MKKILFIIWILFFSVLITNAADLSAKCAYIWEFNECKSAIKNWTYRNIDDFVCISSRSDVEIMYQIVLDKSFKKIDAKIENYLSKLETWKSYYFWNDSKNTFLSAIDEIESSLWIWWKYRREYQSYLNVSNSNSIVQQAQSCFKNQEVSTKEAQNYIDDTTASRLIDTKMTIYKQVAYDIMKLNKSQIRNDNQTYVTQDQTWKYDKIVDLLAVNLWYLDRIWKKWPSKTTNAK